MDSQIRSLIASHGGYTYEIAGCVVAFFSDPRQSRRFGDLLARLAQVAVDRCGTQLSFPVSARLSGGAIALPAALARSAVWSEPLRPSDRTAARPSFRNSPGVLPSMPPESEPNRSDRTPWGRAPASTAAKFHRLGPSEQHGPASIATAPAGPAAS